MSQVSYLDASGKEALRVSPLEPTVRRSRNDLSSDARFLDARSNGTYLGDVYFRGGSQPHMTISVAEGAPGRGVVVAEIDLRFVRDVIDRARVGSAGYAYAIDRRGRLVAHPDINLVLKRTSFATLPQVRQALERGAADEGSATTGRDLDGEQVLSAFETIDRLGWRVFVEEPQSEAFAPLYASIKRTALFLVALPRPCDRDELRARPADWPGRSRRCRPLPRGSAAGALDERIDVIER